MKVNRLLRGGYSFSRLLLLFLIAGCCSRACGAETNGQPSSRASGVTETNVNGIIIKIDNDQSKNSCPISSLLDSNLVAALVGAVTGLVGYYLGDHLQRKNKRKSDMERYLALLESARDELRFYVDKFGLVSSQLNDLAAALKAGDSSFVLPSYTVYPAFLEKMRLDLVSFGRNREIVRDLGGCYFELGHILERLNHLKSTLGVQNFKTVDVLPNIGGAKGLVDQNIQTFTNIAVKFEAEIGLIKTELKTQY